MTNHLKSCPFCGGTNIVIITCGDENCGNKLCVDCPHKGQYSVCCDASKGGCGTHTGYARTKEKAIELWERRVEND